MTTGPHQPDQRDPRRAVPPPRDGARGGRGAFSRPAAYCAFLVALTLCSAGVLWYHGRETGAIAVAAVNALALVMYLAFMRAYERIEPTRTEELLSWLVWTLFVGIATVFYAIDWRVLGACVLVVLQLISLANLYFIAMRPDVVDALMRRARERDGNDAGPDDDHTDVDL